MKEFLKKGYSEIRIPSVLSIIVTYCCFQSLVPIREDAGLSVCMLLIILSYISACTFEKNIKSVLEIANTWWKRALLFLLFLYFNFCIYGIVFLEKDGMDGFCFNHDLYLIFTLVWSTPLFSFFLTSINKILSISSEKPRVLSWKVKISAITLMMIYYLLWLYAYNPCITSPDSAKLFDQAHQMRIVPMTNWHPPFYTIILSLFVKLYDSISFFVIIQCLLYAILVAYMLDYLVRLGCNPIFGILLYVIWGYAFNNAILLITLWKDIPFMISITWLTFLLSQLIIQKYNVRGIWYVNTLVALICTSLFRQNGILPAISVALVLCVVAVMKRKWSLILIVFTFFMALFAVRGPLYSFYNVQSKPGLKFYALANDIVGTYYEANDNTDEVVKLVNEVTNNSPQNYDYNAYLTNHNRNALDDYTVPSFVSVYLNTFLRHPKTVIIQFLRRNSVMWSVIKPLEERQGHINYRKESHENDLKYMYPYRIHNGLTSFFDYVSTKMTSNSLIYVLAWRTGIYFLCLMTVLYYCLIKRKMDCLIVFSPVVINSLSLCISSGWPDYRYYWSTAIITLYIIPFIGLYFDKTL